MAIQEVELRELVAKYDKKDTAVSPQNTVEGLDTTANGPLPQTESTLATNSNLDINTQTLASILETQDKVNQVKVDLNNIVDAITKDPSIITQWSTAWGELPMWQKILGGVVLTVPALTVGIALHIPICIASPLVAGALYTGSGVILDDHFHHQKKSTDDIKRGVTGLANLLGLVITALEQIHAKLKSEVEKFAQQNVKLADSVSTLQVQVHDLQQQVKVNAQVQKYLSETEEKLREALSKLDKQSDNLEATVKELEKVRKDYAENEINLTENISKLERLKGGLEEDINRATEGNILLMETIKRLSNSSIQNKAQRDNFLQKFEDFCKNKETVFQELVVGARESDKALAKTNEELGQVRNDLFEAVKRNEALLAENRTLQEEFKGLVKELSSALNTTTSNNQQSSTNNEQLAALIKSLEQKTNAPLSVDLAALARFGTFQPPKSNNHALSAAATSAPCTRQ